MSSKLYAHFTEIDLSKWYWPSFLPKEIACKGSGELLLNPPALNKLQSFRNIVGVPVVINSAYRSEAHNKAVGGSPTSQHRLGSAFDIRITDRLPRSLIHSAARVAGFTGFGDYNSFVHIDTGTPRTWDLRK